MNATQKAMNAVRNAWHYAEIAWLLRQTERKIAAMQRRMDRARRVG